MHESTSCPSSSADLIDDDLTPQEVVEITMQMTWLSAPDTSSTSYGSIPLIDIQIDKELFCPAGEIRLPLGDKNKGYRHLEEHDRFRLIGIEKFVYSVTSLYDEIWVQQGENDGLLLLRYHNPNRVVILSRNIVDGAYWVVTAFPLTRRRNHRKLREVCVWRR